MNSKMNTENMIPKIRIQPFIDKLRACSSHVYLKRRDQSGTETILVVSYAHTQLAA